MKMIEIVDTKNGVPYGFWTSIIPFRRLCRCISKYPGVVFAKRRFFWSGEDVCAEFRFKDRDFKIENIWGDLHVGPKDDNAAYPEIAEIREHVERNAFSPFMRKIVSVLHYNLTAKKANANHTSESTS